MVRSAMILMASVLVAGCVANRQFQKRVPIVPCSTGPTMPDDVPIFPVEFDDQGIPFDRRQIAAATREIVTHRPKEPAPVVVIFVHGWQNNAESCSTTLVGFEKVLQQRKRMEDAYATRTNTPPRKIIGIYIGWRGKSLNAGPLDYLTFWGRAAGAARVAQSSLVDTVMAFAEAAKAKHALSQVALIGHSFGGAVVEKVMTQLIVTRLSHLAAEGATAVALPVDMAVLLNPASSALDTWRLIDALMERAVDLKQTRVAGGEVDVWGAGFVRPVMVSVTAKNDCATGRAYPFGQRFYAYPGAFRKIAHCRFDEAKLFRQTGGHTPELFSHAIGDLGPRKDTPCHEVDPLAFEGTNGHCYVIVSRYDWNRSPYWVLQAPKTIINGHNGIYEESLGNMIVALLDAYAQDGGPVTTTLTAKGVTDTPDAFEAAP